MDSARAGVLPVPLVVDVVLPVLMQRQALAVLVSYSGGATNSVLRRHGVPVWGLQVPPAFTVPWRVWKNFTHFLGAVSRRAPVFARQFTVAFGRISVVIFVLLANEPSADGNLDTCSGSLFGWSLSRNAWFGSGFIPGLFSLALDEFLVFFREGELTSRSLLLLATLDVGNGSVMFYTGFAGIDAARAAFPTFAGMSACTR